MKRGSGSRAGCRGRRSLGDTEGECTLRPREHVTYDMRPVICDGCPAIHFDQGQSAGALAGMSRTVQRHHLQHNSRASAPRKAARSRRRRAS
jgi:hypothetical protein